MSLHKLLLVVFLGCIQPMSSPMMKRMLGFCCCCAAAGVPATETAAHNASRPAKTFLAVIACSSLLAAREGAAAFAPQRRAISAQLRSRRSGAMAGNQQQP